MIIQKLQKNIPSIYKGLRHLYGMLPLQFRLGKMFYSKTSLLEQTQTYSVKSMRNYQNAEINKLIRHVYDHVPFYAQILKARGMIPDKFNGVEDLKELPILTKKDIQENSDDLQADNFRQKDKIRLNTSGTTGTPLYFTYDKSKEYLNYDPFIWRFFGWAGHKLGELRATLANWTLPEGQICSYNRVRDILILSAYRLNESNAVAFADAMAKRNVRFLDGYPSSIELWVQYLKEKNITPPTQMKAVFCHSEYLHDWQRKSIEEYFGCKCFNWYAMEERCILGLECEKHEGLHLIDDFGVTEFLGDGEYKKIVATSLENYAMPFIRYDTGDAGRLLEKTCSCGRGFPLFEIAGGREKSFAVGKDGSQIPVANIDVPNVTENVYQFQFIQNTAGRLELNIVKKANFGDKDIENIRSKLYEKFENNMDINIQYVREIPSTGNNKRSVFIQRMQQVNGER